MADKKIDFQYEIDQKGDRVYKDPLLNVVQQNLLTLSTVIDDIRVNYELNIPLVQGWANAKTVKDPTVQTISFFTSKIIEGLGVIFTAGTPEAIISTISCKLISGLITHFSNPQQKDSYNQIQAASWDLKLTIDKYSFFIQNKLAFWLDDLEKEWDTPFTSPGIREPEFFGTVKLSDLYLKNYLPKKGSKNYVFLIEKMNEISIYETTKTLLPIRWRIRRHRAFPHDGFGDLIKGWQVEWYKVRGRGTWDSWRSSSEFPKIPSHLSGDIEGPYEEIEKGDTPRGQFFSSWYQTERTYPWSDGSKYEDGKREYLGTRWMGFSGSKDHKIDSTDNDNLTQGTSFLDLRDDILNGVFTSYGEWEASNSLPKEPSYYLWYKTKRPGECEIINDRRVWTLMGNSSTQDWVYDSNSIFTWGRAYRGITLNHYTLVDENGNYAPGDLCKFLFIDNGHGKIINPDGICQVGDFYHNWGFSFE